MNTDKSKSENTPRKPGKRPATNAMTVDGITMFNIIKASRMADDGCLALLIKQIIHDRRCDHNALAALAQTYLKINRFYYTSEAFTLEVEIGDPGVLDVIVFNLKY